MEGIDGGPGHRDGSLKEHHVEPFIVFGAKRRIHDDCVKLVLPPFSNTVYISLDHINVVDVKI